MLRSTTYLDSKQINDRVRELSHITLISMQDPEGAAPSVPVTPAASPTVVSPLDEASILP